MFLKINYRHCIRLRYQPSIPGISHIYKRYNHQQYSFDNYEEALIRWRKQKERLYLETQVEIFNTEDKLKVSNKKNIQYLLIDENKNITDVTVIFSEMSDGKNDLNQLKFDIENIDYTQLLNRIKERELTCLNQVKDSSKHEGSELDLINKSSLKSKDQNYNSRSGNWVCKKCKAINYRGRTNCFTCNESITNSLPLVIKIKKYRNQWICKNCFMVQANKKMHCVKCLKEK